LQPISFNRSLFFNLPEGFANGITDEFRPLPCPPWRDTFQFRSHFVIQFNY
jgi:hypothetical protein